MNRIFATHAERAVQKSWTGDFSGLGNTFNTMAKLWPRVWKLLSGVFVVELAAAFWPLEFSYSSPCVVIAALHITYLVEHQMMAAGIVLQVSSSGDLEGKMSFNSRAHKAKLLSDNMVWSMAAPLVGIPLLREAAAYHALTNLWRDLHGVSGKEPWLDLPIQVLSWLSFLLICIVYKVLIYVVYKETSSYFSRRFNRCHLSHTLNAPDICTVTWPFQ